MYGMLGAIAICYTFSCFHSVKKLDVTERNIVNVLHQAKVSDGHWEQLGLQLIEHTAITEIKANQHIDTSICMIETISRWLRTDPEASWEKLAAAVAKVEVYGEATAHIVQQKAKIVFTCMFISDDLHLCIYNTSIYI